MKGRICMVTLAVVALFAVSVATYADNPNEGFQGALMMGGGGNGGMSGHGGMGGGGMMGWDRGLSALWEYLANSPTKRNETAYDLKEAEALRKQIREKRQELSDMLRADNPDKERLDEKIDELNRLESELDQKTSAFGPRR